MKLFSGVEKLVIRVAKTTLGCSGLLLIALFQMNVFHAYAQDQEGWTQAVPLGLLTPDYKVASPEMTVDIYGFVHVVAPRNSPEGMAKPFDGTIIYTYWDGKGWSDPNDIIVAQDGEEVSIEEFVSTSQGSLHLLWWTLNGYLYWSHADALEASSAHAWKTMDLVPGATGGDLVVRDEEDIAVIYIQDNDEVVFQRTLDGGATWPIWTEIWAPPTERQASRLARLAIDGNGVYHVAWTETDADLNWSPSGIWYARSIDGGSTWMDFNNIRDMGSYANIGFDSDGNVHLLWDHNVSSVDGRYSAFSIDGGKNWTEPEWIFPGLSGRTGYPRLFLDSEGTLHQITSGFGREGTNHIFHSQWLGDRWSDLVLISEGVGNSEGPAAAIVAGNHLFVGWRSWDMHDVVYSEFQTGSSPLPLQPTSSVPTPDVITNVTEEPVPGPITAGSDAEIQTTPVIPVLESGDLTGNPLQPVAIGILPSFILICGALIYWWAKWHR